MLGVAESVINEALGNACVVYDVSGFNDTEIPMINPVIKRANVRHSNHCPWIALKLTCRTQLFWCKRRDQRLAVNAVEMGESGGWLRVTLTH